jgi:aspartate aminotransferase-like enzyme
LIHYVAIISLPPFLPLLLDRCDSSANKCIEGLPGFTFAICRKSALQGAKAAGAEPSTLALDIIAQRYPSLLLYAHMM